jgi:hypothetical protein
MTTVIDTPQGIEYYRLAACKARVKIEKAGIKFKGPSTTAAMRVEFNLPPRAKHDLVIAAIQAKMEELLNGR